MSPGVSMGATKMNLVVLVGRLGADPELRYTQSQKAVANFNLAVSKRTQDREITTWVRIVAWEKLAEIASKHLNKGSRVLVNGELQERSWEKDGQKRSVMEVVAHRIEFMDPPKQQDQQGSTRTRTTHRGPSDQRGRQQNASNQQDDSYSAGGFGNSLDDIPF